VLRKVLAAQADGSVVMIQVGFSTNLARLLLLLTRSSVPICLQQLSCGIGWCCCLLNLHTLFCLSLNLLKYQPGTIFSFRAEKRRCICRLICHTLAFLILNLCWQTRG